MRRCCKKNVRDPLYKNNIKRNNKTFVICRLYDVWSIFEYDGATDDFWM